MAREIVVTRVSTQKTSVATVGPQGFQGYQGPQGNFGGATFAYDFNTSTSAADPGAGKLALNNTTFSSATVLYLDDVDMGGIDIQSYLRTIDDSTSTIKGHFRISERLDPQAFVLYTITSLTEETGYFAVTCSYVSGSSPTFTNNEDLLITFARTGDKGEQGPQGFQGFQGFQGNQGFQGFQGFQGNLGLQGYQGTQGAFGGPQGYQGYQGFQGDQGNAGANGPQGDWSSAQTLNAKTDTYVVVAGDVGKLITLNKATGLSLTVNTGLGLTAGQRIDFIQIGAGQVTIDGTATVLGNPTTKKLRGQYSAGTLIKATAADTFYLVGDLAAS